MNPKINTEIVSVIIATNINTKENSVHKELLTNE